MYNQQIITDLKTQLSHTLGMTRYSAPTELEHHFFVELQEVLENSSLCEYRYDIYQILICYSALSKVVLGNKKGEF